MQTKSGEPDSCQAVEQCEQLVFQQHALLFQIAKCRIAQMVKPVLGARKHLVDIATSVEQPELILFLKKQHAAINATS